MLDTLNGLTKHLLYKLIERLKENPTPRIIKVWLNLEDVVKTEDKRAVKNEEEKNEEHSGNIRTKLRNPAS